MSVGSQHSVHFPPPNGTKAVDDKAQTRPTPAPDVQPSLVLWGRMNRAAEHVQKQIKHLPSAELDYHGTLRMIVTASADIGDLAKELLKMLDNKGHF